jgi:hypothetical protein
MAVAAVDIPEAVAAITAREFCEFAGAMHPA